jgi:hypothetical protein
MRHLIRLFLICVVCVLASAAIASAKSPQTGVKAVTGPAGLTDLSIGGTNFLSDGAFRVTGAFFLKPSGDVVAADLTKGVRSFDKKTGRVTWTYPWGSAAAVYTPKGYNVNVDVYISVAESSDALAAIYVQPAVLKFAAEPKFTNHSFLFYTKASVAHNQGSPGIMEAGFKNGVMLVCNEQMDRPLCVGFDKPTDKEKTTYPLIAYTGRHPVKTDGFPFINRVVYPGGRDHFKLSVRFGPSGSTTTDLAQDLFVRYAKTYPYELKWADRRPIGRLFISSAHNSYAENYPKNPRGWLNDSTIDVTTPEGLADFKNRTLAWVDGAVRVSKGLNAQGILLWDPEGQEHPHAISYIGDPRSIPAEMEPIIDEVFKKFTDAGLRTGICIRPQSPMRPAYGTKVDQINYTDTRDRVSVLSAKIDYAKKRWGCTLYYMDSNIFWTTDPFTIPGASGYSAGLDDDMLCQLTRLHPDCLIIPEWESLRSYAYSAPYTDLNYNKLTAPPAEVLAAYPQAFFANTVSSPQIEQNYDALLSAVKRGDILMPAGWYDAPENAVVKKIYGEAHPKL